MNLVSVAEEIQHRIIHIFGRDMQGRRATNGGHPKLDFDPHFRDYVWFYEVCWAWILSIKLAESTSSSSMETLAKVLVHLTKLVGLVWLHTTSCRAESVAGYQRLPEVSVMSNPFGFLLNLHLNLAPRSILRHYFDVGADHCQGYRSLILYSPSGNYRL